MKNRLMKITIRVLAIVTLIYLGVAIVTGVLIWLLTPNEYFAYYPSIDIFFWLCGIGLVLALDRSRIRRPEKLTNVFMLCRAVKFALIIAFLLINIRVLDKDKVTFTVSLMCNYAVYSAVEIYIYSRFNKRVKAYGAGAKKIKK